MPYKDREKNLACMRKYYQDNKEKQLASSKQWKKDNPEAETAHKRAYRSRNLGKFSYYSRTRKAAQLNRTPSWSDQDAVKQFYDNRPDGYHVDHIIPMQGKLVSGLHVIGNLQYLTEHDNCTKWNRYE